MIITTIQSDIIWESVSDNLKLYQEKIENLSSGV